MKSSKIKNALSEALFFLIVSALIILISIGIKYGISSFSNRAQKTDAEALSESENANDVPTVIIDAGHGGEDGGASSKSGILEKDLNLDIAFMLKELLEEDGINVIMTRSEDILLYDRNVDYNGRKKVLDLAARLKIANGTPNAIFVSIHMNSFPEEKYHGLQVYYSKNDQASAKLAKNIQDRVKKSLQPDNNRKEKVAGKNIFILDRAACPAVLIECGFLSNQAEAEMLSDDEYKKELAFLFFCSLCEFIFERE